jgi:hypothetical protein
LRRDSASEHRWQSTMALVAEVPAVLAEWTHVWCMRSFGISNALLFATESEMILAEAECWVALMNWIHLVISCSVPGGFVWSQAGEFPTRWEVSSSMQIQYPISHDGTELQSIGPGRF